MSSKKEGSPLKAIATARKGISASLRALDAVGAGRTNGELPVAPEGLHMILTALLANVRKDVTALAMAFKPPVTASAVGPQLDKLEDHVGRMVSCVLAVAGAGGDGASALVEDWSNGVRAIGGELERLYVVLEDILAASGSDKAPAPSANKDENPYLAHTGMVWEAIDRLKATLPADELAAVRQRWEGQKETVRDAWTEFKEFLEDQDEQGEGPEDAKSDPFGMDDDDEWAELQNGFGGKLSATERRRAEAAKPLLGLHQILHATLPRYLPVLVQTPDVSYSPLLDAGALVVASFDNAVSAMYPGQDMSEILSSLDGLAERTRELSAAFRARVAGSTADAKERETAKSFAERWEARLEVELTTWGQKRLNLADLADALP